MDANVKKKNDQPKILPEHARRRHAAKTEEITQARIQRQTENAPIQDSRLPEAAKEQGKRATLSGGAKGKSPQRIKTARRSQPRELPAHQLAQRPAHLPQCRESPAPERQIIWASGRPNPRQEPRDKSEPGAQRQNQRQSARANEGQAKAAGKALRVAAKPRAGGEAPKGKPRQESAQLPGACRQAPGA